MRYSANVVTMAPVPDVSLRPLEGEVRPRQQGRMTIKTGADIECKSVAREKGGCYQ